MEPLHRKLGHDRAAIARRIGEAFARTPAGDAGLPFAHVQPVALAPGLDQLFQHGGAIAHDAQVHRDHLVDAGAVDIDVDLGRMRAEGVEAAGHAVIEAGADVHHHVALVHRHVGFQRAVHAQHAQPVRVTIGEGAKAHQRGGNGHTSQFLQLAQQGAGARAGIDDPAAGVEDRAPGIGDQLDRFGNLVSRGNHARLVAARTLYRRGAERGGGDLHVLRDVDHDRAGAAGGGDLERLVDGGGKVRRVLHQVVVLAAVAGDADGVGFLEGVSADQVGRHLPGDHHHRDRIEEGIGNPGDRIGRAGAGCDQHHAGLAGGPGIAFCGMGRAGFVPYQDMADAIVREQFVIDRQHGATRIAEHEFDPLAHQHLAQYRSAAAFFAHLSFSCDRFL